MSLSVMGSCSASLTATSVSVAPTGTGSKVSLQIAGNLSMHGVTKPVTATAQAQLTGDKLEIAGSVVADMSEFGVSPPHVPFVAVDSQVTIEFDVFLVKS